MKRKLALASTLSLSAIMLCSVCAIKNKGNDMVEVSATEMFNDTVIEVAGIATKMTLAINGGDGEVWATAKNSFTLLPAVINVYVYLYYSYEKKSSYEEMKLADKAYINDLDQGKTLTLYASTEGEERYWQARMYYRMDENDWIDVTTDTYLYDGDGYLVM